MSPNVGNFVHDLVEMAKAMEALPMIQQQLDEAEQSNLRLSETIGQRELSIMDLKSQIEALNAKLRQAEVDRESAETMFLEADERTSRALDFIKATFGNAGSLIQALEPPRPEPTPAPVPVQAVPEAAPLVMPEPVYPQPEPYTPPSSSWGQSEPHPTDVSATPQPTWSGEANSGASPAEAAPMQAEDQSASPLPIATTGGQSSEPDAPIVTQAASDTTTDLPYAGKAWRDVLPRVYVYVDWIAGGGTDAGWYAVAPGDAAG
jgi:hypothetical protein